MNPQQAPQQREPTAYERQLARREKNPRRQRVTMINVPFAILGVLLLVAALKDPKNSPYLGFFGWPLLIAQVCLGLVPAVRCVASERMSRGARLLLLGSAILGPAAAVSAWLISVKYGSVC